MVRTSMPNYVYNVVYRKERREVIWKMEPEDFPGTAREFARGKLLAWLADNSESASQITIAGVNVWDADQKGAGNPKHIICQLSSDQLDEGPFDPDTVYVPYMSYYISEVDYDFFEDDIALMSEGAQGLIVPGDGPAIEIRTGGEGRWISRKAALRDSDPDPDLDTWEAIEQVAIEVADPVRFTDKPGGMDPGLTDLRGGRDSEYLAIRVSVRGRDKRTMPASGLNPRRTPWEHHLIETWPAAAPAPHVVLKRDETSRYWESTARPGR
jgi:hypothetical protein